MKENKIYIDMCREAKEIQELAKVEEGSWFFCECKDMQYYPHGYGLNFIGNDNDADNGNKELIDSPTDIWLPTQEQLQDIMIDTFKYDIYLLMNKFCEFSLNPYAINQSLGFKSNMWAVGAFERMNQLWLAFVMKEKFGKIWINGKWTIL